MSYKLLYSLHFPYKYVHVWRVGYWELYNTKTKIAQINIKPVIILMIWKRPIFIKHKSVLIE